MHVRLVRRTCDKVGGTLVDETYSEDGAGSRKETLTEFQAFFILKLIDLHCLSHRFVNTKARRMLPGVCRGKWKMNIDLAARF